MDLRMSSSASARFFLSPSCLPLACGSTSFLVGCAGCPFFHDVEYFVGAFLFDPMTEDAVSFSLRRLDHRGKRVEGWNSSRFIHIVRYPAAYADTFFSPFPPKTMHFGDFNSDFFSPQRNFESKKFANYEDVTWESYLTISTSRGNISQSRNTFRNAKLSLRRISGKEDQTSTLQKNVIFITCTGNILHT